MSAPHLAWALEYALLGWRVHPCHWITSRGCSCNPGGPCKTDKPGKHPRLPGWPDLATTDPALIERWWGRHPSANIGLATGAGSGVLALDVDGPEGERALVDLERQHGPLPDLYPMQWTGGGRGGWQAFFAYPAGRQVGNSVGRLGPALDTRGERGNAVLPPSVTTEPYRWADDRSPATVPPEPAPAWLVELLDPPAPTERPAWAGHVTVTCSDRYLEKALTTELKLTARAPEGERNAQLFESAVSLLRFVAAGQLPLGAVAVDLRDAARAARLPDIEITRTLKSAAARRGINL